MGHYLSEMEGEPFTQKEKINKDIGHVILKDEKHEYASINYCEVEWITNDPKRKWIYVYYQHPRWGSCVHSANYNKYKEKIKK